MSRACLEQSQTALPISDRSSAVIAGSYRFAPGAAPQICAASPMLATALTDSALGSTVSASQLGKEQRYPARNATALLVARGKSHDCCHPEADNEIESSPISEP